MDWVILRGVPSSRLLLGIPFYGRHFATNAYCSGFTAQQNPEETYALIAAKLANPAYAKEWDDVAMVPFLIKAQAPPEFVSYDDSASVGMKCNMANAWALSGVAIWECTQ